MRQKEENRQAGMLTVEAVLSLVPFILVILGIISFINIFAVHNKIQYALYQMGNELSGYTYFYQALGVRGGDLALKNDIDKNTEKLDKTMEDFTSFLEQIGELEGSVNQIGSGNENWGEIVDQGQGSVEQGGELIGSTVDLLRDPKGIVRGLVYLGIEKAEGAAKSFLLSTISDGLMQLYLDESFAKYQPRNADAYLKAYGVKDGIRGLDFSESDLFNDKNYRMIDIVVEYDIEVYFFKLFLKDPTIHVVQRCAVPAWLDGDGGKR
ncbi:MAG: pilus assembly protein [bacterium]|nr:pilus assembly protein [bacterium]